MIIIIIITFLLNSIHLNTFQYHNNSLNLSPLLPRSQEPHVRYEPIYIPEANSQSELEYGEMKRPRLEIAAESVMRHQPQRPPLSLGGNEDVSKVC